MSAHTKGPWSYGVRKDGSIWLSIGNPKTGPHYQGDLVASEANARLIANAPRLLEALREQIETWVEFSRTELELCNRLGTINTPTLMRIFAARAAIYEATGEAP